MPGNQLCRLVEPRPVGRMHGEVGDPEILRRVVRRRPKGFQRSRSGQDWYVAGCESQQRSCGVGIDPGGEAQPRFNTIRPKVDKRGFVNHPWQNQIPKRPKFRVRCAEIRATNRPETSTEQANPKISFTESQRASLNALAPD